MSSIGFGSSEVFFLARAAKKASEGAADARQVLASSLRINKASDDAAGLALSQNLLASAKISRVALRNVSDGISLTNVAGTALDELSKILTRQMELAAQAQNSLYSTAQRQQLESESVALTSEFNRIVATTSFNNISLLSNPPASVVLQAGIGSQNAIPISLQSVAYGTSTVTYTSASSISGDGTFKAYISSAAGSPTGDSYPTVADLDGDGDMDLVSSDTGGSTLRVQLNNGSGVLSNPTVYTAGSSAAESVVRDVDGDNKVDIVIGYSSGRIGVLLGNGNGTFKAPISYAATTNVRNVQMTDMNGDNVADIVVTSRTTNQVAVLIGNSNGTYNAPVSYSTGTDPYELKLYDIDGDGDKDVFVSTESSSVVTVYKNNGSGVLSGRVDYAVGLNPYNMEFVDVNKDGYVDLVTANFQSMSVSLGNSNGTFNLRTTFGLTDYYEGMEAADINGDGYTDLVVGVYIGGVTPKIGVFLGQAGGTFSSIRTYGYIDGPSFRLADMNGDGITDIVGVTGSSSQSYVLLGNASSGSGSSSGTTTTTNNTSILTSTLATLAYSVFETTFNTVEARRGDIRAAQARLEVAARKLAIDADTYQEAYSRITDADIAQTVATYVTYQIREQAATALLAQANQRADVVLKLLQ